MTTDPARLASLMQDAIASATTAYTDGGSLAAYEKEMQRIIARGHAAAWLAGTSERLGVPLDSPLLSQARLSRAERADIKALVTTQLEYLKGFTDAAGDMSPEAVAARANLYSGAVKGSYSASRWSDIPLPFQPTEGTDCRTNCGCSWQVAELDGEGNADATWLRSKDDSCDTCLAREADNPYRIRGGELQ